MIVIVLTLTMLAGTCYYAMVFLFANSRVEAVSVASSDDLQVRIALIYGSSVTVNFKTVTDYGFSLGYNDSENTFTEITTTDTTALSITCDRNLVRSGSEYALAANSSDVTIGAYHIKIKCESEEVFNYFPEVVEALPQYHVFPGYYDGVKYIMIGQFSDSSQASSVLSEVISALVPTADDSAVSVDSESQFEDSSAETVAQSSASSAFIEAVRAAVVSSPSDTAVMAVDSSTDSIVWIFDDSSETSFMGVKALQIQDQSYSYIKGYKGGSLLTYDDVLECSVYNSDGSYGIKVINVLPVETYIAGVIPYEIGNTWPLETQKAFAIAVRSYAISHLGRHKSSYNADLCCTANCQVYKGFGSTNARVRQAVEETRGLIAVYNGRICETYYSSSTGGCTANVSEVWGSNQSYYGYLKAVATPWEQYTKYGNGSWTSSATGTQIYQTLVGKGYTALKSAVTKIDITYATNSTYVYAVTFYDSSGNSLKISKISKVKSALSPYLKSGNFVVAKAGEKVTRTNYTMMGFGASSAEPAAGVSVKTNPFDHIIYGRQTFSVLTAEGLKNFVDSSSEHVATADGTVDFNMSHSLDSQYYPTVLGVNGEVLPDILNLDAIAETETLTAEGSDGTFVFIGRGWGHGVGLSQWGIKDLGDLGYDYETIFKAYYTDADIIPYTDYLNN